MSPRFDRRAYGGRPTPGSNEGNARAIGNGPEYLHCQRLKSSDVSVVADQFPAFVPECVDRPSALRQRCVTIARCRHGRLVRQGDVPCRADGPELLQHPGQILGWNVKRLI
jgi:hypothetical protein